MDIEVNEKHLDAALVACAQGWSADHCLVAQAVPDLTRMGYTTASCRSGLCKLVGHKEVMFAFDKLFRARPGNSDGRTVDKMEAELLRAKLPVTITLTPTC